MSMLQLNPPIPLTLESGEPVWALAILDYGPDYDSLFLVACQTSRELWWLPNSRLRLGDNLSLGRPPVAAAGPGAAFPSLRNGNGNGATRLPG